MLTIDFSNISGPHESPDIELQKATSQFHALYEQLEWEMRDARAYCYHRYGVDVASGSGYQDLVNGLLQSVMPIIEQEMNVQQGDDRKKQFFLGKLRYFTIAIENIKSLSIYHELLVKHQLFAKNESLTSPDAHNPRKGNIFSQIYAESGHDRKKFIAKMNEISMCDAIENYVKFITSGMIGGVTSHEDELRVVNA